MSRKKKALTIEQHKENGKKLTIAREAIIKTIVISWGLSPSDRKLCYKDLYKALDIVDEVRNKLDSVYHEEITDDEFKAHGHVYYGRS